MTPCPRHHLGQSRSLPHPAFSAVQKRSKRPGFRCWANWPCRLPTSVLSIHRGGPAGRVWRSLERQGAQKVLCQPRGAGVTDGRALGLPR